MTSLGLSSYEVTRNRASPLRDFATAPVPRPPLALATQPRPSTSVAPRRHRTDWFPYALLIPSALLILVINIYPFFTGFMYSLRDGNLLKPGDFVAIQNYLALFGQSDFQNAVRFSALFALFGVLGGWLVGLGLALLLNQDIPLRGMFRVALLLPWIIPSIVSIVSWRWMLGQESGLVNTVLGWFGLGPIYFLSTGPMAQFSIIIIKIWRSFPFMMLSLLAALQTINRDMYEAASIDGAGHVGAFRYITLPLLMPISIVLWILMTIFSVNDFETPYLLTRGGPSNATETLAVLAYRYVFGRDEVGVGAAISILTMVVLLIFAIMLLRRQREIA